MYREIPPHLDLPALDREVLDFWRDADIFAQSVAQSVDRPLWTFNEGPPTANGLPGIHHVEARAFKDLFPRYRTMKGYHVPRKAGWDCHGLPVEIAVERELGFRGKGDIEAYGIAEFNAKCRESVFRHVDAFTEMTQRMGFWLDFDSAYWTMDRDYIDSVWWSLQVIYDKGLLTQDYRISPYCPRCGTALSDHETSLGYETVVDPSVYVRLPVTSGSLADRHPGVALLIWTTTPWTLVANTAAAVNPDVSYVVARTGSGEVLVVAEDLREVVLGAESEVLETLTGQALVGTPYQRPFDWLDFGDELPAALHTVLAADFVTTVDGTGIVHEAPAFGPEDLILCRSYGLPVLNPVRPDGRFEEDLPLVGGLFFKKADAALVDQLASTGALFRHVSYEHSYPHCWRCHTPLLYYALPSWYIRTTEIKDKLLEQNAQTTWYPDTIKWGRFGDWLTNNVDWALSRDRYWGTPLPIWRNDLDDSLVCVGSIAELGTLAGVDLSELDPHRPFVDDITFAVDGVEGVYRRVPEVIDCWYDSGSMPFAQFGYPHRGGDVFPDRHPADFICEAIDQTRGWFYTLMAIGTLVFDESSYRTVLCLGHILDDEGRKMSKHLGNVLEPVPLMDQHGADAVRWFMLASGSPWQARRISDATIAEVVRKVLLTYWNTVAFQALYAQLAEFEPSLDRPPSTHVLDRWLGSRSQQLARNVDEALDQYDTARAGRLISAFVDELSNWYVRRSRRRFWAGDDDALQSLHDAIRVLTLVLAPLVPFVTERIWQDLFVSTDAGAKASVHLASWPSAIGAVDCVLEEQVALVRRLVELGRAGRAATAVRTRQPLATALIAAPGWSTLPEDLRAEFRDELNVVEASELASVGAHLVELTVKPNFRSLGKRFGARTKEVAAAVSASNPTALVSALRADGVAAVDGDEITAADILITETPSSGWAVQTGGGETVALDLTLTPKLERAGLARETIRFVQEHRKATGLRVSDRIALRWESSDSQLAAAIEEHDKLIAAEVLAIDFQRGLDNAVHATGADGLDLSVQVSVVAN